jgi:HEAT repeat protein
VKRLVDDPDASVRDAAAWALDRLGANAPANPGDNDG